MNNFKEKLEWLTKNGYEYGTGVLPYINNKLGIKLNEFGEYQTFLKDDNSIFNDSEVSYLEKVNVMLSSLSESDVSKNLFSRIPNMKYSKPIGYYLDTYVGYVSEGEYRENASSGGFGTWIFTELMDKGYIDSVIHIKKAKKDGVLFEYSISKNKEEVIEGAKTKYYPVELSEVLDIVKKIPGKYAVIGLPSYIMELRLLAMDDSIIRERILFMIGLVCGHQKSTKFADILAWQCGIKPGNLKMIDFRKKLNHGPSSSYAIEVTGTVDGEEKKIVREMKDLYGGDWGKGLFKVRASDFSDDVMNETADLTLGDAWLPKYTADNKGNNILVVRNPIIAELIKDALLEKRIVLDTVTADTIYQSQISHYRHTQDELCYRLYKMEKKGIKIPVKRFESSNKGLSFERKRIQDIREKICEIAPVQFNKAVEKDDLNYFMNKLRLLDFSYKIIYKNAKIRKKLLRLIGVKS